MDADSQNEKSKTLLDEADFLRLMEAEYKNFETPVNELEKQKTWAGIKKQLPAPKPRFHRGWLLVAVIMLGLAPFLKSLEQRDELGIKGTASEPDVQLDLQLLHPDGQPQKFEKAEVGQTLLFKVSSAAPSYLALAVQIDAGTPRIQFQLENPVTGQDQILAAHGQAFVYQLDQPGQTLKFCLVAATNRDDWQQKMAKLAQHWPPIGGRLCQTFVVQ